MPFEAVADDVAGNVAHDVGGEAEDVAANDDAAVEGSPDAHDGDVAADAAAGSDAGDTAGGGAGSSRTLRTAGELRAFSHPLRLRLMELLDREGPLTATRAAALADTTPSNASFHLRLLARHGLVEEAPGGTGRQRPWRAVAGTLAIHADQLDDAGRAEVRGLVEIMAQRYRHNALAWQRHRAGYDQSWRAAAGETHLVLSLTAAELAELRAVVANHLNTLIERTEPSPAGERLPVAVLFSAVPAHPTQQPAPRQENP